MLACGFLYHLNEGKMWYLAYNASSADFTILQKVMNGVFRQLRAKIEDERVYRGSKVIDKVAEYFNWVLSIYAVW